MKIELDDLSLKYLKPEVYYDLVEKINLKKSERQAFIDQIVGEVRQHISNAGIHAQIDGRIKHFFSIYKKMVNQDKTLDQIYDLFAVRIIVDTVKDCYASLGIIHEMYKPIPGRFKDYIAMPKPNMYQSLHTTLIGPNGQPFEIQIRTFEMHRTAEYGIAAHWKYKEVSNNGKVTVTQSEEEKMNWLRQILEWQRDMSDNKEFLSLLKSDLDLFSESVYCFTPAGDVKNLPNGSTPIDFAYNVHSAVGNKMVGARVNGKLVPIEYVIQNGDQVEIITSQNSKGPSRDWLKVVKSTQAKNKINQWFKQELKEDNILKGKDMLIQYAKIKSVTLGNILKPKYQEAVMKKYGFRDWDSVLAALGHGGLKEGQVINKLQEAYNKVKMETDSIINAYFNGLNNTQKVLPENIFIYTEYSNSISAPTTRFMVEHLNDFPTEIRQEIKTTIEKLYATTASQYLNAQLEYNNADYEIMKNDIKKLGLDKDKQYDACFKFIECRAKGDMNAWLDLYEKEAEKLTKNQQYYLSINFAALFKTADDVTKKRASKILRSRLENMDANQIIFAAYQISELEKQPK